MKKTAVFISMLLFTILTLSVVQVVVANMLSTKGVELGRLQDDIKKYKTVNSLLAERLLEETSLTRISSNAALLGFSKESSQLYLSNQLPLAVKQ